MEKLFGVAGGNNNVTVLDVLPLIFSIANVTYTIYRECFVKGVTRNKRHWLLDGIYPRMLFYSQFSILAIKGRDILLEGKKDVVKTLKWLSVYLSRSFT